MTDLIQIQGSSCAKFASELGSGHLFVDSQEYTRMGNKLSTDAELRLRRPITCAKAVLVFAGYQEGDCSVALPVWNDRTNGAACVEARDNPNPQADNCVVTHFKTREDFVTAKPDIVVAANYWSLFVFPHLDSGEYIAKATPFNDDRKLLMKERDYVKELTEMIKSVAVIHVDDLRGERWTASKGSVQTARISTPLPRLRNCNAWYC